MWEQPDKLRVRFAEFEADLAAGELYRNGLRLAIQEKPFHLLTVLVRRAGEFVSREELGAELWPGVFVTEEQSLNTAVHKLRLALHEHPEKPRFLETVGGRGYRFVHPVEVVSAPGLLLNNQTHVRVGVFPFRCDGPRSSFSIGFTELVVAHLGTLSHRVTVVIPAVEHKEGTQCFREICRELNLNCVLTGSLRQRDGQLRVTAMLLGEDQSCIWTKAYESGGVKDLRAEEHLASQVAIGAYSCVVPHTAPDPVPSTIHPAAQENYLQGRYFWNRRTGPALVKAIKKFRAAIAVDPRYALPHAWLAHSFIELGQYCLMAPRKAFARAITEAKRSLSLDSQLGEGCAALAWARLYHDLEWERGEADFLEAIKLNPNHPLSFKGYALLLTARGQAEEAIRNMSHARDLDPTSGAVHAFLGFTYLCARQDEEALPPIRKALDLDFRFPGTHAILGQFYLQKHELKRACQEFELACEFSGNNAHMLGLLAYGYAVSKQRVLAVRIRDRLLNLAAGQYVPSYSLGLISTGLGEGDAAIEWFRRACQDRCSWTLLFGVDPKLDSLRAHPGFNDLLNAIGLEQIETGGSLLRINCQSV